MTTGERRPRENLDLAEAARHVAGSGSAIALLTANDVITLRRLVRTRAEVAGDGRQRDVRGSSLSSTCMNDASASPIVASARFGGRKPLAGVGAAAMDGCRGAGQSNCGRRCGRRVDRAARNLRVRLGRRITSGKVGVEQVGPGTMSARSAAIATVGSVGPGRSFAATPGLAGGAALRKAAVRAFADRGAGRRDTSPRSRGHRRNRSSASPGVSKKTFGTRVARCGRGPRARQAAAREISANDLVDASCAAFICES